MKIALGADQVGYPLKQAILDYLISQNYEIVDFGTDSSDKAVDYPDFARKVAFAVSSGECERGVLVCGTGVGMTIAANKFPGVRAAWTDSIFIARQCRIHNDANVLCMGALVTTPRRAEGILEEWLSTSFEFGRHVPRLAKLDVAFQSERQDSSKKLFDEETFKPKLGVAISPRKSVFGPLMFAGELEKGLSEIKKAGFDAVELSLRCPGDLEANYLKQLLNQNGLFLSAIATGQSCLHDQLCLCSPDAELRAKTVERLKGHIDLAANFDAKVIIGGIRGRLTGTDEEQEIQLKGVVEAIAECARYAQEKGVVVLLEPINRYETNFINSLEDGIKLIDQIGFPSLKLLPDTFHMNSEESDISLSLRRAKDYLGYIHFADSNRLVPGKGHINFPKIVNTLAEIGFDGVITVEALPLPSDKEAVAQASGFLKS